MDPVGQAMMGLSVLLIVLAAAIPAIQQRRAKKNEKAN